MTDDRRTRKTGAESLAERLAKLGPSEWHEVATHLAAEPWGKQALDLGHAAFDQALNPPDSVKASK